MSNNTIPSLEILPVELLYRIFDNLETETILLSIRSVSRLFRLVTDNYDRYVFNLKLISKSNFYLLCRLISPKNVLSLIFSNNQQTLGQLDFFLSLVRLQEFTRLRSLAFINIDEIQLNFILKRIKCNTLISLSCNIRTYYEGYINATTSRLSSIIAQSTLRKLKLDIGTERMSKISWPSICTIEHLTIHDCITVDNLCKISQYSPHLRTLVMKETYRYVINNLFSENHLPINFQQLTSLTMDEINVSIDKLESFLLLTPSLIHLKLIDIQNGRDGKILIDGERWEEFIKINLPQLKKFEFYFSEWRLTEQTQTDLDLTIASFRTPFWIEDKKWFVICECDMKYSFNIRLYSIPICQSSIFKILNSKKFFSSTYPMAIDQDVSVMDNINLIYFGLEKSVDVDTQEHEDISNHLVFPKVTQIDINLKENSSIVLSQSLPMFINVSQIVQVTLNPYYLTECNQNFLNDIRILLEATHRLISLIIVPPSSYSYYPIAPIENIHSIIPSHVKNLDIPIDNIDEIKMIMKRCQHLLIVQFYIQHLELSEKVIEWFEKNTINSTYLEDDRAIIIWLGKKNNQSTDINIQHKRIKLINESSNS